MFILQTRFATDGYTDRFCVYNGTSEADLIDGRSALYCSNTNLDAEAWKTAEQARLDANGGSGNTLDQIILRSPDGNEWSLTVDNSGVLTTTQI